MSSGHVAMGPTIRAIARRELAAELLLRINAMTKWADMTHDGVQMVSKADVLALLEVELGDDPRELLRQRHLQEAEALILSPSTPAAEREHARHREAMEDAERVLADDAAMPPTAETTRPMYVLNLARAYLALRAEVERLTKRVDDDRQQIIAATAACLNTGAVTRVAVSLLDGVHDVCAQLAEVTRERDAVRESLAVYVHAHKTGNAVPPHIEARTHLAAARGPVTEEPVAWAVVDTRGRVEDGRIRRHRDKAESLISAIGKAGGYRVEPLYFGTAALAAQEGPRDA